MRRAVISLFLWDGCEEPGEGEGWKRSRCRVSIYRDTLSCCTSDEVHLLYFPPGKGKSEHATFSPWSGSIATAEVSPPVLSAV